MSVDGATRPLPEPFIVLATQNPIEYEGTYPLPEAQLDRFLFKLQVGYPDRRAQEQEMLARHDAGLDPHDLRAAGVRPVAGVADLAAARRLIDPVRVDPAVRAYIVALCRATREHPSLTLGVSPRGATMLLHAAKTWAWLSGRDFVTPDEVKGVARPCLRHRVLVRPELAIEGASADAVLDGLLATVPTPLRNVVSWPVPTWRLAALVAASGVVLLVLPVRSWAVFWALEAVVLAVFLADAFAGPTPRAIVVERDVPGALRVGDEATLAWTIEHRGRGVAHATVTDALWPSLGASRRSVEVRLASGGRMRATATLRPTRRGRFPLDDVTVRVRSPLGLAVRHGTRVVDGVVRVYPSFPSRDDDAAPRPAGAHQRRRRAAAAHGRGGNTEFDQLRDYTPDDEFRRIDWAATARAGGRSCATYRVERNQTVMVLLDNGRVMAGSVAGVPARRARHGRRARAHRGRHPARRPGRAGELRRSGALAGRALGVARAALARVAEAMYLLEPELAESDYAAAFAYATARIPAAGAARRCSPTSPSRRWSIAAAAAAALTRTHLVVVAAVQRSGGRAVGASGSPPTTTPAAAFRAAAAVGALESPPPRAAACCRAAGGSRDRRRARPTGDRGGGRVSRAQIASGRL